MNEQSQLLTSAVGRLFEDELTSPRREQAQKSGWCDEFWDLAQSLGLQLLLVREHQGGFDGTLEDACAVARLVGRHAVPLPIVEDLLARGLMAEAGITPPDGVVTLAVAADLKVEEGFVDGTVFAVPWGRFANYLLVDAVADGGAAQTLLLSTQNVAISSAHSLSGEPSDDLMFTRAKPVAAVSRRTNFTLRDRLVALRIAQMAGALQAALELTIDHANQRVQFGKPIGKFQAVQQQLAVMAEETAAVAAAAEALGRIAADEDRIFETAAAKLRANRAIDVAVPIAHQTLGAMGFAAEHGLHRFTQRLLGWRTECGGDQYWATRLGEMVVARGAGLLWPDLTSRTDSLEIAP